MTRPTTVAIAQADSISRGLVSRVLRRWGMYDVIEVADPEEALGLIHPKPDITVLDWDLLASDTLELCRRLRSERGSKPSYFIVMFSPGDNDEVLEALEAGTDDYTIKPVDPDDLLERVTAGARALGLRGTANDPDGRYQASSRRHGLSAIRDRGYFERRLAEEMARATRDRQPLALTLFELDGTQGIKDAYGGAVAHEVLRQVGAVLANEVRRGQDVLARYGDESFAVISAQTNARGAKALAERVRKRVLEVRTQTEGGYIAPTCSAGVAVFGRRRWGQSEPARNLTEAAEHRLYQAKLAGGNRTAA